MLRPHIVRAEMGLLSRMTLESVREDVLVLVLGNKAGMKFMLLCFWHEVAPALDGMAGHVGLHATVLG